MWETAFVLGYFHYMDIRAAADAQIFCGQAQAPSKPHPIPFCISMQSSGQAGDCYTFTYPRFGPQSAVGGTLTPTTTRRRTMAFLKTINPEEAEGKTRELFDYDLEHKGYIANYSLALSTRPEVLTAWRQLQGSIRRNMRLRRYELVTIAAAKALSCTY
jgi:hypothetical protein